MTRHAVCAAVVLGALIAPAAAADPPRLERIEVEEEVRQIRRLPPRKDKGTFLIGEVSVGPVWGTSFPEAGLGFGLRMTAGVGGGFKGFAPRFYFITAARYARLTAHVEQVTLASDITRQLVDLSAGLRIYVPVQRLRFLLELSIGASLLYSEAHVNQRQTFETDDVRFAVYPAFGLQYRLHRNWSVGALAELALPTSRPVTDFISQVSRVPDDQQGMLGWVSLTANVVAHF